MPHSSHLWGFSLPILIFYISFHHASTKTPKPPWRGGKTKCPRPLPLTHYSFPCLLRHLSTHSSTSSLVHWYLTGHRHPTYHHVLLARLTLACPSHSSQSGRVIASSSSSVNHRHPLKPSNPPDKLPLCHYHLSTYNEVFCCPSRNKQRCIHLCNAGLCSVS